MNFYNKSWGRLLIPVKYNKGMIQMSIFKIGMRGRRQQLQVESQFLQRVEYMFAPLSLKKLCQNLRIGK